MPGMSGNKELSIKLTVPVSLSGKIGPLVSIQKERALLAFGFLGFNGAPELSHLINKSQT